MKHIVVHIVLYGAVVLEGKAQDYNRKNIDQARLVDEIMGFQDQDINYEVLYENVAQLLSHPVNINRANAEELRFLNILSEAQIQNLLQYRNEYGDLLTIYELQAIPNFDLNTIYRFIPFVTVPDPSTILSRNIFTRALKEKNNYFMARYERISETKAGYKSTTDSNKQFKGSANKMYYRFRTSRPGDFSFGFTAEKDAGERFTWRPSSRQYGFDFLSAHAQIQNKGLFKNLIIGDFQNQFGQGLIFGGIFGIGKGAETITTTRRSNIGFLPNTSANEFGMLRGVASTCKITSSLTASFFYSRIRRDAGIHDIDDPESEATSFQTTGLHRNEFELQYRRKILERNSGIILHYNKKNIDAGMMYNDIHFNRRISPNKSHYNQFAFEGEQNRNAGIFFNYTFNNILLFGEISKSLNGGAGRVIGIMGSLTNKLDLSLLYRKYDRNFHTFYANAFTEGTNPQNESGMYWGLKYRWNKKLSLMGYVDIFSFSWLRFRSYKPAEGYEWLSRLSYQPSKQILIFVQGREERKVRNVDGDPALYITSEAVKRNYTFNCDYGLTQKLKMKTHAQASTYQINHQTTQGFALIQDLSLDIGKFEFTIRHALFDSDDYDNRQYVYEKDVWLAYSLPAYYGKGQRNFVLIEYDVTKRITCWARYARTSFADREEIGSGLDKIEGNTKNDIKFQVRLKL